MAVPPRLQRSDLYMTELANKIQSIPQSTRTRRDELIVFLVIAALIWPVAAVGVVGGYGFAVWMYQVVVGPPGPPRR
jgi:periplasmic nitrate reductase NapE